MHSRRILLAFSLAASAASVAFADLVQQVDNTQSPDRLEQLTKTLSQGAYSHPDDMDIPAQLDIKVSNKDTVELTNALLNTKYPEMTSTSTTIIASAKASNNHKTSNKTSSNYSSNSIHSWLVTHPLPNSRVSSNYGGRTMGGRAENHSGLDQIGRAHV